MTKKNFSIEGRLVTDFLGINDETVGRRQFLGKGKETLCDVEIEILR